MRIRSGDIDEPQVLDLDLLEKFVDIESSTK